MQKADSQYFEGTSEKLSFRLKRLSSPVTFSVLPNRYHTERDSDQTFICTGGGYIIRSSFYQAESHPQFPLQLLSDRVLIIASE